MRFQMSRVPNIPPVFILVFVVMLLTSCARSENAANIQSATSQPDRSQKDADPKDRSPQTCVNINTASAEELIKLPGVGEVTARRIVEYRERNGEFRRKQEIIIIDGFSEKKYREIEDKICVD